MTHKEIYEALMRAKSEIDTVLELSHYVFDEELLKASGCLDEILEGLELENEIN